MTGAEGSQWAGHLALTALGIFSLLGVIRATGGWESGEWPELIYTQKAHGQGTKPYLEVRSHLPAEWH